MIFPVDVTTSQLRAFFRLVHTTEGAAHMHTVATELHMDLTKFLPVLDAAKMLGLVTVEKGGAKLTNVGAEMRTRVM